MCESNNIIFYSYWHGYVYRLVTVRKQQASLWTYATYIINSTIPADSYLNRGRNPCNPELAALYPAVTAVSETAGDEHDSGNEHQDCDTGQHEKEQVFFSHGTGSVWSEKG